MEGAEQAYRNALYYRSNMADMLYNLWVFLITLIVAFNIFVKHWPQFFICLFVFNLLMLLCIYNHLIVLKREWMIGKTLLSHVYIDQSSSERKCRLVFNSPGRCPPDSVINDAVLVWGENTKHRPVLSVIKCLWFAKLFPSHLSAGWCWCLIITEALNWNDLLFRVFKALNCQNCLFLCLLQWFAATGEQQVLRGTSLL